VLCLGLCSSGCVPSLLDSRSSHILFWWFLFLALIFSLIFLAVGAARPWIFCWVRLLISSFGTRSLSCLCLLGLCFALIFLVSFCQPESRIFPSTEYFAVAVVLRTPITAPAKCEPVRSQASSFLRVTFCRSLQLTPCTPLQERRLISRSVQGAAFFSRLARSPVPRWHYDFCSSPRAWLRRRSSRRCRPRVRLICFSTADPVFLPERTDFIFLAQQLGLAPSSSVLASMTHLCCL
jgi:hypothetical protein